MAYDEALAARIREHVAGEPVVEKKMFGGLAFLVNGHLSVSASGQGGLLVRVEPDESDALLDEPGVTLMQMGNRAPMAGWLRVAPEVIEDDAVLERWVERGLAHAKSLAPTT
ncbi:TfoX/Sxy family protein [Nocardioides cynanchi]|uniref:TfoX/Sxy family protein n=1 Tax=Nocardioides cynanchi TaxID=2558918 RepID=UPI0012491FB3|nr:TfoX/Sxy family protein [Nocardioides cynanchi]